MKADITHRAVDEPTETQLKELMQNVQRSVMEQQRLRKAAFEKKLKAVIREAGEEVRRQKLIS